MGIDADRPIIALLPEFHPGPGIRARHLTSRELKRYNVDVQSPSGMEHFFVKFVRITGTAIRVDTSAEFLDCLPEDEAEGTHSCVAK